MTEDCHDIVVHELKTQNKFQHFLLSLEILHCGVFFFFFSNIKEKKNNKITFPAKSLSNVPVITVASKHLSNHLPWCLPLGNSTNFKNSYFPVQCNQGV